MDIHPPLGRVESVREFLTHILIVTIGILIALGLEGMRESWREHSQVREARKSFQEELGRDMKQLSQEQESLHQTESKLDKIISDMPELVKSPPELRLTMLVVPGGMVNSPGLLMPWVMTLPPIASRSAQDPQVSAT